MVSQPDETIVHVIENLPPVAVALADVTSGLASLTVNLDGSHSYDPEGGLLSYDYNFNDGTPPSNGVSPTHTFTAPGTYHVGLAVIEDWGRISGVNLST